MQVTQIDFEKSGTVKLLTPRAAWTTIGVGRSKFYQLLKASEGPPYVVIGGRKLFPADDLQNWIDSHKKK